MNPLSPPMRTQSSPGPLAAHGVGDRAPLVDGQIQVDAQGHPAGLLQPPVAREAGP